MKKIIICMAALIIALTACTNKSERSNDAIQSEASETPNDVENQGNWLKQTSFRTNKPMVVDFYATWCGPCKELAPILDEAEKNHDGEIIFKRVDVDQEAELALEFNIDAIPVLMFITPAGEYQTLVGLQSPEVIEAKIQELLQRSGSAA